MSPRQTLATPSARLLAALLMTLLALAPLPARAAEIFSAQELMQATGLDRVFDTYGRDIAFSVRQQPVSPGRVFVEAWEATARTVFDAEAMHGALESALTGIFTESEQTALREFYLSDFGKRLVALEAAVSGLEPERQLLIEQEGTELWEGLPPARQDVLIRIQAAAGGEMVPVMLRETMRALYMGMSLAAPSRPGALDWETVDQLMPELTANVESATRALSAVVYEGLEDSELEAYAAFLDTAEARKFYGALIVAMTGITVDATEMFGRALSQRLTQQGV